MANVTDFISKLKGGGARNNQFKVTMPFPGYAAVGGETESMAFLCTATNLPQSEIGELTVNFIVDENMENWTELYTWMEQTTGSTDPEKFRSLVGANRKADQPYDGSGNYDELYSDMTIVVTTAANNPNRYVRIQDAFPTSLGEITMDTTVAGGITYVTCNASFQFTAFEIASTS